MSPFASLGQEARRQFAWNFPGDLTFSRRHARGVLAERETGVKAMALAGRREEVIVESGAILTAAMQPPTLLWDRSPAFTYAAYKGTMRAVYTNTPVTGGSRGYEDRRRSAAGAPDDLGAEKLGIDLSRCGRRTSRKRKSARFFSIETLTQEKVLRLRRRSSLEREAGAKERGWRLPARRRMSNYMDVSVDSRLR